MKVLDISARITLLEERNETLQSSLKADINMQLEESNSKFREGLRAELKAENEKLIKK
jgi:hypothetical protein